MPVTDGAVLLGLVVAAVAWALLFALGRGGFWPRPALAGAAIGGYGLVVLRDDLLRLFRPTLADVAIGVVSAAVLCRVLGR